MLKVEALGLVDPFLAAAAGSTSQRIHLEGRGVEALEVFRDAADRLYRAVEVEVVDHDRHRSRP